jgi:hypothetical protein
MAHLQFEVLEIVNNLHSTPQNENVPLSHLQLSVLVIRNS